MLKYRPELSRNIDRNNNLGVLAGLFALSVVFLILHPVVPATVFNLWIGAQLVCHLLRFIAGRRLVLTSRDSGAYRFSVNFYIGVMILSGTLWGMSAFLAEHWGNILHQLVILAIVTGIIGGSITTISPIFPAFIGFISISMVLQALGFVSGTGFEDFGAAPNYEYFISMLIILYLVVIYQAGRTLQKARVDTLELQAQLVKSKEEAEWANNAKSRFLSSVSHELRTP
jgi:signal transduction histidine kinase